MWGMVLHKWPWLRNSHYDPVCGVIYLYGVYCTCAGALESQAKHPTRLPGSFRLQTKVLRSGGDLAQRE